MIISASRRTDIPAFYAEWFMNRIRAGFCAVPNPFNRAQVSRVSLLPEDVDVIIFWSRNPRPMFIWLDELDRRGYRYYFQYTVMDNPRSLDLKSPPIEAAVHTFQELALHVGADRVIWRYDPIVFSDETDPSFHQKTFKQIAETLSGSTRRSVISIMDVYAKARNRLNRLPSAGFHLTGAQQTNEAIEDLISGLVQIASDANMEIVSCAEEFDLGQFGVRPGKCVDDEYIRRVFGIEVTPKKDPSQRKECGCVVSKDIGMYDSCLFGCQYCYATQSFDLAHRRHDEHDPLSPSLVGWYEPTIASKDKPTYLKTKRKEHQLDLFTDEP